MILEMIWLWYQGSLASTVASLVDVSKPTVVDWLNFLREVSSSETF
jgi:transposase